MKNAIISSIVLLTSMFCQTMMAQESDAMTLVINNTTGLIAPSQHTSQLINEGSKPRYEFNINAGQHAASFDGFHEYISAHLIYPKKAIENGVEGKVIVTVEISAEGKVLNPIVMQSLGTDCDEVVLYLLHNMPYWKPAMNYGIPVKTKRILEFSFGLR